MFVLVSRVAALCLSLSWLTLAVVRAAEPSASLTPDAPYQANLSRTASYDVDFRVTINPPKDTRQLKVWLPLPPTDATQRITQRKISTFPREVDPSIESEPIHGNTFAYFEFDSPKGAQQITHQFKARISQLDWNIDYDEIVGPDEWPKSFAAFQRADPRLKRDGKLSEVMVQVDSARSGNSRLLAAMDWVDRNLQYDSVQASLNANPMHALNYRRGHCSDYHGLCGTLAREIGFPSRVLYGLQMFDKASPSHCKLDVFLPPHGWVSFDLSETQKAALKIAADESLSATERASRASALKERTKRGFRENTWLLVTKGTNYELAPPASQSVPLVRTIYAEADGVVLDDLGSPTSTEKGVGWTTMHRVDETGDASRRFTEIE